MLSLCLCALDCFNIAKKIFEYIYLKIRDQSQELHSWDLYVYLFNVAKVKSYIMVKCL